MYMLSDPIWYRLVAYVRRVKEGPDELTVRRWEPEGQAVFA